jgi:hypothetical protein
MKTSEELFEMNMPHDESEREESVASFNSVEHGHLKVNYGRKASKLSIWWDKLLQPSKRDMEILGEQIDRELKEKEMQRAAERSED